MEVYRHGPHGGEEPPVSATRGSGTVFFSRCTLRCLYCQNHPWSQEGEGKVCGTETLAQILGGLAERGCHNWNLVSPTPWLPMIGEALERARESGHSLPIVYNTSGFERVETLTEWQACVDVFLVDLRYAHEVTAVEGSDASGYVETARAAIQEMWRQKGPLTLNEQDAAVSGVICRLLILPGHADEAVENLRWLARTLGTDLAVSVMAQYLPAHRAGTRAPWHRRISRDEYDRVCRAVEREGFHTGWIQAFGQDPSDELVGFRMAAEPPPEPVDPCSRTLVAPEETRPAANERRAKT